MSAVPEPFPAWQAPDRSDLVRRATAGWLLGQRSTNTRNAYQRGIERWIDWAGTVGVDPLEPARHEITAWIADLGRTYGPETVKQRITALRGWLHELTLSGVRSNFDPTAGVKLPHRDHQPRIVAISTDDVRTCLAAARELKSPAETVIALLATMGLRAAEAGRLSGVEVQPTPWGDTVLVERKGGHKVLVPLSPTVRAAADRVGWPNRDPDGWGDVLESRWRNIAYKHVSVVAKRTGLRVHPHAFRHWYVTTLLDNGVPLHEVQDAAGHASPETTRGYDRLRGQLRTVASANELIAGIVDGGC